MAGPAPRVRAKRGPRTSSGRDPAIHGSFHHLRENVVDARDTPAHDVKESMRPTSRRHRWLSEAAPALTLIGAEGYRNRTRDQRTIMTEWWASSRTLNATLPMKKRLRPDLLVSESTMTE